MFGYNGYQPQQGAYNAAYQPQQGVYPQTRMDFLQQSMQPQQSGVQARFVANREEAMAATVFPGSPVVFVNRGAGEAYWKNIDPQTGAAEFVEFAIKQPVQQTAPQYVTVEMFDAWRAEIEGRFTSVPRRPQKGADAE